MNNSSQLFIPQNQNHSNVLPANGSFVELKLDNSFPPNSVHHHYYYPSKNDQNCQSDSESKHKINKIKEPFDDNLKEYYEDENPHESKFSHIKNEKLRKKLGEVDISNKNLKEREKAGIGKRINHSSQFSISEKESSHKFNPEQLKFEQKKRKFEEKNEEERRPSVQKRESAQNLADLGGALNKDNMFANKINNLTYEKVSSKNDLTPNGFQDLGSIMLFGTNVENKNNSIEKDEKINSEKVDQEFVKNEKKPLFEQNTQNLSNDALFLQNNSKDSILNETAKNDFSTKKIEIGIFSHFADQSNDKSENIQSNQNPVSLFTQSQNVTNKNDKDDLLFKPKANPADEKISKPILIPNKTEDIITNLKNNVSSLFTIPVLQNDSTSLFQTQNQNPSTSLFSTQNQTPSLFAVSQTSKNPPISSPNNINSIFSIQSINEPTSLFGQVNSNDKQLFPSILIDAKNDALAKKSPSSLNQTSEIINQSENTKTLFPHKNSPSPQLTPQKQQTIKEQTNSDSNAIETKTPFNQIPNKLVSLFSENNLPDKNFFESKENNKNVEKDSQKNQISDVQTNVNPFITSKKAPTFEEAISNSENSSSNIFQNIGQDIFSQNNASANIFDTFQNKSTFPTQSKNMFGQTDQNNNQILENKTNLFDNNSFGSSQNLFGNISQNAPLFGINAQTPQNNTSLGNISSPQNNHMPSETTNLPPPLFSINSNMSFGNNSGTTPLFNNQAIGGTNLFSGQVATSPNNSLFNNSNNQDSKQTGMFQTTSMFSQNNGTNLFSTGTPLFDTSKSVSLFGQQVGNMQTTKTEPNLTFGNGQNSDANVFSGSIFTNSNLSNNLFGNAQK